MKVGVLIVVMLFVVPMVPFLAALLQMQTGPLLPTAVWFGGAAVVMLAIVVVCALLIAREIRGGR